MKKIILIISSILVISALGSAYWFLSKKDNPNFVENAPDSGINVFNDNATTTPQEPKDALPKYKGQALNFLGDPEVIARYPKEFVDSLRKRLENAISFSKKFPEDENYWIEIGIVKKALDNYSGAKGAWNYASLLNRSNPTIYLNLANLHALYLRDFKTAEENYQRAIALSNFDAQPYLALAEFYKDFYTEKSDLVDDVLLQGLDILPDEPNLNLNLALYYKSVGDKENAIKYFEKFLKLPGITGTQQAAIESEINALR